MTRSGKAMLVGPVAALLVALTGQVALARTAGPGVGTTITTIASTVPSNGDVNPYGVAVVPMTEGRLVAGDVLVSNFNDSANLQGTGTTIVQISPGGHLSVFARIDASELPGPCPGGVGLTTALAVFRSGWVIVGSLPTKDGTSATAKAGCLLVLDRSGRVVETFSGRPINGPWDMASLDMGHAGVLFVSNVLNGTVAGGGNVVDRGTVVRIGLSFGEGAGPQMTSETIVASGFGERTDPAALVVGPTGLGLAADGTLYVADTVGNSVAAIANALHRHSSAGTGTVVTTGGALNGPLGLTLAANGDILTVNAGDGNLVETTPAGEQVQVVTLDSSGDPPGAGALFGLALTPDRTGVYFVDDTTNTLDLLS